MFSCEICKSLLKNAFCLTLPVNLTPEQQMNLNSFENFLQKLSYYCFDPRVFLIMPKRKFRSVIYDFFKRDLSQDLSARLMISAPHIKSKPLLIHKNNKAIKLMIKKQIYSPLQTRHITCSRLYFEGKNMRRQCQ